MNADQEAQFEAAINATVAAIAVKLPEFWTSDPIMWFRQAGLAFAAPTSPPAAPCTTTC
jgi:hypothetical protein